LKFFGDANSGHRDRMKREDGHLILLNLAERGSRIEAAESKTVKSSCEYTFERKNYTETSWLFADHWFTIGVEHLVEYDQVVSLPLSHYHLQKHSWLRLMNRMKGRGNPAKSIKELDRMYTPTTQL
jgi:hypothetical protein